MKLKRMAHALIPLFSSMKSTSGVHLKRDRVRNWRLSGEGGGHVMEQKG